MTVADTTHPNMRSELVAAIRRRPFTPFAVATHGGEKYRVTREFQSAANESYFAMITKDDRMIWIKLADIAAVQPLPSPRRKGGRGKSR